MFGQSPQDDGLQPRIDVRIEPAGRHGLLVDLLEGDGDGVGALEGHLAGGGFVEHNA